MLTTVLERRTNFLFVCFFILFLEQGISFFMDQFSRGGKKAGDVQDSLLRPSLHVTGDVAPAGSGC
jgi:hypothetical protein